MLPIKEILFQFLGVLSIPNNTTKAIDLIKPIRNKTSTNETALLPHNSSGHQRKKKNIQIIIDNNPHTASFLQETRNNGPGVESRDVPTIGISFFIGKKSVNNSASSENQENIDSVMPKNNTLSGKNHSDKDFLFLNGTRKVSQQFDFEKQGKQNTTSETTKIVKAPPPVFYLDFDKLKNKIRKQNPALKSKWKSYLSKLIKDIDAYKRTLSSQTSKKISKNISAPLNKRKKDYIIEVDDDDDDDNRDDSKVYNRENEENEMDNDDGLFSFRNQIKDVMVDDSNDDVDGKELYDNDLFNENDDDHLSSKNHGKRHHKHQHDHHRRIRNNELKAIISLFKRFLNNRSHQHRLKYTDEYDNDRDDDSNNLLVATTDYNNDHGAMGTGRDVVKNVFSQPYDLEEGFISGNRRRLGQKLFGLSPASRSYQVTDDGEEISAQDASTLNSQNIENSGKLSPGDDMYQPGGVSPGLGDSSLGIHDGVAENILWRDPNTNQLFILQEEEGNDSTSR